MTARTHALADALPTVRAKAPTKARRAPRQPLAEAAPRVDIYAEVTAKIIAQLEAGVLPWVQPWSAQAVAPSLPFNASTGRRYSGVNVLMLWSAAMVAAYPTMGFMTFAQARDLGASVRKGERGTMIVYADRFIPEVEKARAVRDGDDARGVAFLKRFVVFNVAQIDGLPAEMTVAVDPVAEVDQHEGARKVIEASGVTFRVGGDKAFYMPSVDAIAVPPVAAFHNAIDWNRTALHELCHSTGHSSRLDRKLLNQFGSKDYAFEELIAEMGSAFLCATLGIVPTVRHADYISSWLEVLRNDNRFIFRAASQASKAADWLLSRVEG